MPCISMARCITDNNQERIEVYRKRKCAFSQKHTIFITKIQVYMFLLFVVLKVIDLINSFNNAKII